MREDLDHHLGIDHSQVQGVLYQVEVYKKRGDHYLYPEMLTTFEC